MNQQTDFVEKFCKILVKNGAVTEENAKSLKQDFYDRSKDAFDYFLIDEGLVSKEQVLKALSDYYQLPSMDVRGYLFDHDLVRSFPKDFLLQYFVIPVEVDQDILTLVTSKPDEPGLLEGVEDNTSYTAEFLVGQAQDIRDAIREFYDEPPEGYIHDTTDEDETEDAVYEENFDIEEVSDKKRW